MPQLRSVTARAPARPETSRLASPIARATFALIATYAALAAVGTTQAYAQATATGADAATTSSSTPAQPTAQLTTTTVTGDRSNDYDPLAVKNVTSGALGTRKAVDTPFSTTTVTNEQAQDLMATSINDVFKYDPSVAQVISSATGENAVFSVRGLAIDMLNGIKVDGQSFPVWDADLAMEPFEKVELLKGAGGFMYGFATPGGMLNYVMKRPTDDPYRSATIGYTSANIWAAKLDVGGRFGPDNQFGYRVNLVNEEGNSSEARQHIRRKGASLALDWRITPDLTWSADVMYQDRKSTGTIFGLGFYGVTQIPSAKSVKDLSQPQNWYETEFLSVGTGLDYRISDDWRASVKFRFAKENRYNFDSFIAVNDNAGNYTNTLYAALTRYYYQNYDAMLQGKADTWGVKHDLVVGASYMNQWKDYDAGEGWQNGYNLGNGNLFSPTLLSNSAAGISADLYRAGRITQAAIYASDTVHVTSRLSVLLGARYTQYHDWSYNINGTQSANYSANPVSPTIALMYKTDANSTAYVSYVESLEEGASADNRFANSGTTYGPLKSKQWEVGFKTDNRNWGANIALFQMRRGYSYADSNNNLVQNGIMRFQGLDASGWVKPLDEWRVMGGVLLMNSKAVDIDDPSVAGKRVYGAAKVIGTGRIEYNPSYLRELTVAFGGKYVGGMAVDAANTQFIPGYTTFDLSAKYQTRISGKDVVFRAGINNLFDRKYWTEAWGGFLFLGATRTFVANATIQF